MSFAIRPTYNTKKTETRPSMMETGASGSSGSSGSSWKFSGAKSGVVAGPAIRQSTTAIGNGKRAKMIQPDFY
jgi:hypothetical protein